MNKVSVLQCARYDLKEVRAVLEKSIENLGGFDPYIKKGERVLLKVNLLAKRKPEEAVTTHPVFVEALAGLLIENGNPVLIGDSPGGLFSEHMLEQLYEVSGIAAAAKRTGAKLNYNVGSAKYENPKGHLLKGITVTSMLKDVDKVISVSKLKTHKMMTFTGAVKNMFGVIPGVVKAEYHFKMSEYDRFANALIDICLFANPVLSFMDGIMAMEGEGPSSGVPRKLDVVLASDSPFHLDKTACAIISLPYDKVPILTKAIGRGLCGRGLDDIEFYGIPYEQLAVSDFQIPECSMLDASFLSSPALTKLVNRFIQPKPVFHEDKCIGCGICAQNCPAEVIAMQNHKPKVALKNCIRCYCCQELCPKKAVSVRRSFLLKKLTGI